MAKLPLHSGRAASKKRKSGLPVGLRDRGIERLEQVEQPRIMLTADAENKSDRHCTFGFNTPPIAALRWAGE